MNKKLGLEIIKGGNFPSHLRVDLHGGPFLVGVVLKIFKAF